MTPSLVYAHLAVVPVPVSSLPLFQFISPPHSFQMTPFLLSLRSSPQPIASLLPASLPLRLFLSELESACLSQVWVSYFDFLSPSSCSLHLPFSFCCLFIYLHREGWRYGLSGWIDGWREATGEGIWAFDGRSCQSGYYLKDCLVRYCKKVLLWKNCWLC